MPKPTATQATGDQTTDRGGPEVLTAVEAAALLGLNERTIRRAIDRGELPAIRRGRSFAIEPEALEGFRQHYVPDAPPVPSALLHARTLSSSRQESGLHAESAGQAADASLLVGLPHLLTRFIGRERELAALTARLDAGERLVTLTGLGGIGKSRLALAAASEAAPRFADGAAFVALAPVRSADQVLPAILLALGEREGDDRSPLERLTSLLQPRHVLLLLDNVEHVLGVGPALAELLAACPRLTIVATSRSALRIAGERPFPVAPLSLPEVASAPVPVAAISATEAVQLFVDRARIVDDTFALSDSNAAAVAAICRRLDGLPLAIELAAARSAILPPHALLARLEQRLPLLSGGPRDQPDRLQTMRGALTWSEDLLDPQQQSLLHRLAVFVGGIPLSAAEYVGGQGGSSGLDRDSLPSILNSLAGLLESGLLLRAEATGGEPRFAMLEIVREYALDRLVATGEEAATRHAHADWYLAFAEDAQLALWTATDEALLTRLETEHDNFRTALGWAIAAEPNVALRLAGSLAQFWTKRSYWTEGRDWLERALAAGDAGESEARAVALGRLGMLATDQGDYDMARRHLEASLAMADHLELDGSAARARRGLGIVASHRSEFALAMEHFAAALARFRALGDQAVSPAVSMISGWWPAGKGTWRKQLPTKRRRCPLIAPWVTNGSSQSSWGTSAAPIMIMATVPVAKH